MIACVSCPHPSPFVNITACGAVAEGDTDQQAALVVYRMACSLLPTTPETLSTDLNMASSKFLEKQDVIVAQVGDASRNAALFQDICLPAVDSDQLEFNLPLDEVRPNRHLLAKHDACKELPQAHLILCATCSDLCPFLDVVVFYRGHSAFGCLSFSLLCLHNCFLVSGPIGCKMIPNQGVSLLKFLLVHYLRAVSVSRLFSGGRCVPTTTRSCVGLVQHRYDFMQDVTYEVVLFFTRSAVYAQADIIVTVDGHEVFAESREEFAAGTGDSKYQSKRFQARAGAPRLRCQISPPRRRRSQLCQQHDVSRHKLPILQCACRAGRHAGRRVVLERVPANHRDRGVADYGQIQRRRLDVAGPR